MATQHTSSADHAAPVFLSMTVVLYRNDAAQLQRFRQSLIESVAYLRSQRPVGKVSLAVIDNAASEDGDRFSSQFTALKGFDAVRFVQAEGNLGYGRGHNRCLNQGCDFHLILNPDVYLAADALVAGLDYLAAHADVGMVAPYAVNDRGESLFLCKRYPAVLDLLLRGFAPGFIKRWFDTRLARYEMRAEYMAEAAACDDIEIASGCCMLVRSELLQKLGGFSEAYFLYFEDFDLSVRLREMAKIAYVPTMKIVHDGGHAARKGGKHVRLFVRAGVTFFQQHGWRWL